MTEALFWTCGVAYLLFLGWAAWTMRNPKPRPGDQSPPRDPTPPPTVPDYVPEEWYARG